MSKKKPNIDILLTANKINRIEDGILITITPNNENDIRKLEDLKKHSGVSYEIHGLEQPELETECQFEFVPYYTQCYIDYKDVLLNTGLNSKKLEEDLKSCFFHQWNSRHQPEHIISNQNISVFFQLLQILIAQGYEHRKSVLFFYQHALELSLTVTDANADPLLEKIRDLSDLERTAILELDSDLSDDSSTHTNEKKRIFAAALCEVLSEGHNHKITILNILENIQKISKYFKGQFDLYLENFSYEKFVKKLEDSNEKFITRINDTVSKIINQILALPIATATLSILSKNEGIITSAAALSLLGYSIICFLALSIQSATLSSINSEIRSFEELEKIPNAMKNKWSYHSRNLQAIIRRQYILATIMVLILAGCFFYALRQLFNLY